jgi:hypothetical protein
MAATLIQIYQATNAGNADSDGFVQVSAQLNRVAIRNREDHRLRHWGLLEPHETSRRTRTENSRDLWRITNDGVDFVSGRLVVQQKARIYANTLHGFEGPWISVRDALGKKFDYEKLMRMEKNQ